MEPLVLNLEADLDAELERMPDQPAVFLLWPREGPPYLARTSLLRRRLKRLLGKRAQPSRMLNLREVAVRAECYPTASRLTSSILYYQLARRHFPEDYVQRIRLRFPSYVKLILTNEFPRTQVTTRLSARGSLHFGPFRSRTQAERFEQDALDLFQVRRCQEDLVPAADHPGCIYGEMGRCLRPCQKVVTTEEYAGEVERLRSFFVTGGQALLESIARSRESLIADLEFEAAQRQHERYERLQQTLRDRDELAGDVERLNGVAITASPEPGYLELRFMLGGAWLEAIDFRVAADSDAIAPLDRRLRELIATLQPAKSSTRERQEHLALLARWYYSTWKDGEWLTFSTLADMPYRKFVRALSRVAGEQRSLF